MSLKGLLFYLDSSQLSGLTSFRKSCCCCCCCCCSSTSCSSSSCSSSADLLLLLINRATMRRRGGMNGTGSDFLLLNTTKATVTSQRRRWRRRRCDVTAVSHFGVAVGTETGAASHWSSSLQTNTGNNTTAETKTHRFQRIPTFSDSIESVHSMRLDRRRHSNDQLITNRHSITDRLLINSNNGRQDSPPIQPSIGIDWHF